MENNKLKPHCDLGRLNYIRFSGTSNHPDEIGFGVISFQPFYPSIPDGAQQKRNKDFLRVLCVSSEAPGRRDRHAMKKTETTRSNITAQLENFEII